MKFGEKLKKIRIDKGLSQEEFADMLNTSKQVISRYETNQRTPKITVASEYALKLGVPLNYLIDDTQDDSNNQIINSLEKNEEQFMTLGDEDATTNHLAENIKFLRKTKNLSQDYIAEQLGYKSDEELSQKERNIKRLLAYAEKMSERDVDFTLDMIERLINKKG